MVKGSINEMSVGYYANDATSIKKAMNANKTFLTRYINNLRA